MRNERILFRLRRLGLGFVSASLDLEAFPGLVFLSDGRRGCSFSPALSWPYRANPAGSSLARAEEGKPRGRVQPDPHPAGVLVRTEQEIGRIIKPSLDISFCCSR